jgi:hypothetical protein
MVIGLRVCNHFAPSTMSQPLMSNRKHMSFQVILTNLEAHIFTTPSTFHGTLIRNHDLEIINLMDIEIDFYLGNATMNKIMVVVVVN